MSTLSDERLSPRETLLIHYWYILKKRWLAIITFMVILTITVIFGTLAATKYYSSTAVIEISPEAPVVMEMDEVSEMVTASAGTGIRAYYATQYRILKSRSVMEEAIRLLQEQHGIDDFDEVKNPPEFLRAHMVLKPESETHLVNITFEYPDPEKAALFANVVSEVYMEKNLDRQLIATRQALNFLQEQRASYRQRKYEADENVHAFMYDNDLVGASVDRSATIEALAKIQSSWSEVHAERLATEADYKQLYRQLNGEDWRVLTSQLAQENEQLASLLLHYQGLYQERGRLAARYLADHPQMQRVEQEILSLELDLLKKMEHIIEGRRTEMEVLLNRESALEEEMERLKMLKEDLDRKLIELEFLESEAERDEMFYKNLDQRMSEVDLSQLIQANNIRFVDQALPSYKVVRPELGINILMSLVIGLFGGCALAFFMEYLDATVKSREDVENVVGLNFIGVVPAIDRETLRTLPDERDRNIYVNAMPRSTVAECLRSIRTNILFSTRQRPIKRLVITSAVPKEGKSFISSNLSALIAMTGSRVLLIDADLRRPSQHKLFVMENTYGLADVLAGEMTFEDAVRPTHVTGLDLVLAGPTPSNPAELLGSGRMQWLLDSIRNYDVIIVDSPPVNVVADPLMLANLADGVVVVIEANRTSRNLVKQTRSRLEEMNAHILGAVVNKLNVSKAGYGYYYYYDDGYHYYTAEPAEQTGAAG